MSIFSDFSADNIQPRNVNDAVVYGVEIELRQNLDFISPAFEKFDVNLNVSLIDSEVEMDRSPNGEFESKQRNLREGEDFDGTREPRANLLPYKFGN